MNSTQKSRRKANYSTPQQRARRKIAREVAAAYDAILREAEYKPGERRVA